MTEETKKRFLLPPIMIGINNNSLTVLTLFDNERPLHSIEMNDDAVLRLIKILSANINAECEINRI